MLIDTEISAIWLHRACTHGILGQKDTVWIMHMFQPDGGEVQFSPALRYHMQMREKKNTQEAYTMPYGWKFHVYNNLGGRYSFIMVNFADRTQEEVEAYMKDLFRKFDASQLDSFGFAGNPTSPHPALQLVDIITSNAPTFNVVGLVKDLAILVGNTYFQSRNAPVAYDRVYRAAGAHEPHALYSRDYIGANSRYGVHWRIGAVPGST